MLGAYLKSSPGFFFPPFQKVGFKLCPFYRMYLDGRFWCLSVSSVVFAAVYRRLSSIIPHSSLFNSIFPPDKNKSRPPNDRCLLRASVGSRLLSSISVYPQHYYSTLSRATCQYNRCGQPSSSRNDGVPQCHPFYLVHSPNSRETKTRRR